MQRRDFIKGIAGATIASPIAVRAQRAERRAWFLFKQLVQISDLARIPLGGRPNVPVSSGELRCRPCISTRQEVDQTVKVLSGVMAAVAKQATT